MDGYRKWFLGSLLVVLWWAMGPAWAVCPTPTAANAVWVWHYRQALAHVHATMRMLVHKRIGRVYLQIAQPLAAFDAFLKLAHRHGIQVYALDGEPHSILDRGPLLRRIGRIRQHAFDGVQLDIEPYALPGFRAHPVRYIRDYLHLLTLARQQVPRTLPLSVAIPTWFAQLRWGQDSVSSAVLRRTDQVVVMSYHGSLAAAHHAALPVLREAARVHKLAYVGVKPRQAGAGDLPMPHALSAGYVIERYKHLNDWPEAALVITPDAPRSCSSGPLG